MIRFVFRLLALVALVAAVVTGTIDATKSVAADTLLLTPFGVSWSVVSAGSLARLHAVVETDLPPFAVTAFDWLLAQPAAAVFLAIALIVYLPGHRRRSRSERYALS